ncbi:MAG TPA: winged helix-turn-helix transcriptional regulator [Candidatus Thermoplasmatota archaeon]|nr:winged helix-turn-helix transcriptional regulator [Candidatus Thermoplasmatota archaeon]
MIHAVLFGHRGPYRRSEPARAAILAAVRSQPGISRSEIIRLTGLSWGAVAHHVRHLVARGELQVHVTGQRPYYHLAGGDESALLPLTRLLRTEQAAGDIIRALNRNGALSIQALSRDVAADRKTVKRHLDRMREAGVVGITEVHRARFELRSVPLRLAALLRGGSDDAKPTQ